MGKGVLRFFFDYGAGGCLWAGDDRTRTTLGVGPLDAAIYGLDRQMTSAPRLRLSERAQRLRDQLDFEHAGYLNPLYPPDPCLWTQGLCDRFNAKLDELLALLRQEFESGYDIIDEQSRYAEDPKLDEYLSNNPGLTRVGAVSKPTVR